MAEDDKNHWISDLFPVKYGTSDFLFEKKNNSNNLDDNGADDIDKYKRNIKLSNASNSKHGMKETSLNRITSSQRTKQREGEFSIANDFYSKIYSKVIDAEAKERELAMKTIDEGDVYSSFENLNLTQTKNSTTAKDNIVNGNGSAESEILKAKKSHFWEKDDIYLMKGAYMKLKEKSLWLLCILESRNVKIDEIKEKNKDLVKKNNYLEIETTDLKRHILKLEAQRDVYVKNNKELESKLNFYEDCNNNLSESMQKLKAELDAVTKNFNKTLKELDQTESKYENAFLEYKNQSNKNMVKLSKDYELRIDKLKKSVMELETKLFSKDTECKTLIENLKYLDKHFLRNLEDTNRINDENIIESNFNSCNFLNVTDI